METEQERRKRIENLLPPEITQQLEKEVREIYKHRKEREKKVRSIHETSGLDNESPEMLEVIHDFQQEMKAFVKKRDELVKKYSEK